MPDRNTKLPFKVKTSISPGFQNVPELNRIAKKNTQSIGDKTFRDPPAVEGFKIMPKSRGK